MTNPKAGEKQGTRHTSLKREKPSPRRSRRYYHIPPHVLEVALVAHTARIRSYTNQADTTNKSHRKYTDAECLFCCPLDANPALNVALSKLNIIYFTRFIDHVAGSTLATDRHIRRRSWDVFFHRRTPLLEELPLLYLLVITRTLTL